MGSPARTKGCRLCAVLSVLLLFSRIIPVLSGIISLTVTSIECVYEYVPGDFNTVFGSFVVVDHEIFWSFDHRPGIDLSVIGPGRHVVLALKGRARDKFEFRAPRRGMYEFCFKNPNETPEKVSFYIHVRGRPNEHVHEVHAKDGF